MKTRKVISVFAEIMEDCLRQNEEKTNWSECQTGYLLSKAIKSFISLLDCFEVRQEKSLQSLYKPFKELISARAFLESAANQLFDCDKGVGIECVLTDRSTWQCADVADYMMMVADNEDNFGDTKDIEEEEEDFSNEENSPEGALTMLFKDIGNQFKKAGASDEAMAKAAHDLFGDRPKVRKP